jgi:hypothetical protein
MTGRFEVHTSPRFDRLFKKLAVQHPGESAEILAEAISILRLDPYNRTRRYPIKKLEGVRPGDGQYRLRLRRWRFRYDVGSGRQQVKLSYCGLRREDTY